MPRVSKCKQHWATIAPLVVEDNKQCKDIRQIEKTKYFKYDKEKKRFLEQVLEESCERYQLRWV